MTRIVASNESEKGSGQAWQRTLAACPLLRAEESGGVVASAALGAAK